MCGSVCLVLSLGYHNYCHGNNYSETLKKAIVFTFIWEQFLLCSMLKLPNFLTHPLPISFNYGNSNIIEMTKSKEFLCRVRFLLYEFSIFHLRHVYLFLFITGTYPDLIGDVCLELFYQTKMF